MFDMKGLSVDIFGMTSGLHVFHYVTKKEVEKTFVKTEE